MFDGDLPEIICDLEKSGRVVRDRIKSPIRAIRIGGLPGSLDAIGAAGQGTRSAAAHRCDVVGATASDTTARRRHSGRRHYGS
jgi:hypothetical protein